MIPSDENEEEKQQKIEQVDYNVTTVKETSSAVEPTNPMSDDNASLATAESTDVALDAAIPSPDENDLVYPLTIGNINYKVIRLQKIHSTTESAATMCQNHRDKIGSLYSLSIPNFSSWFQRIHPMGKTIIGSWNGDSYGANGPQCLTYSVARGVHLSACTDASVLLCESTFFAETESH
jgi:hypothetical protein